MAMRNFEAEIVGNVNEFQQLFFDFLVYALSPKKG